MVIANAPYENLSEILGGQDEVNTTISSEWDLINLSKKGLKKPVLKAISAQLGVPVQETVRLLGIPADGFARMKDAESFNPRYSEHIIKLAELINEGKELWGEEQGQFKAWLQEPVSALGDKRPIELLDTIYGIEMVITIIGRIIHGVFS